MSKIYWEVLSGAQKKEFEKLKPFSKKGVFAGGTGLALQLYHRRSYDFDIFIEKEILQNFVFEVQKTFGKNIKIINEFSGEISFLTPLNVKITFVHYPFRPVYPLVKTPFISILNWRDIALDKAYTTGRRPQYRDYVDLFFILKNNKMTLKEIIKKAEKKFGGLFSEKLFLGQLIYFEDIKDFTVDFISKKHSKKEIQNFLEKEVRQYKKEIM